MGFSHHPPSKAVQSLQESAGTPRDCLSHNFGRVYIGAIYTNIYIYRIMEKNMETTII